MPPQAEDTPLRIAVLVPHLDRGGVAVVAADLANEMARRGHAVDLLALDASGPFRGRAAAAVRVVGLGCRRARQALPRLLGYLVRRRPDMVLGVAPHLNTLSLLATLPLLFARPRVIVTEQAALAAGAASWRDRLLLRLLPLTYRLAHRVVCCSEGIRRELVEDLGLPARRVVTIHNAVVGPQALADLERRVEDPWLAASEDPLVLTVGRLHPQKDQATLLRAFARLLARRPARLLVLGEGPERAALGALAGELGLGGRVRLAGQVPGALPYMKAARLFVLSSRYEGLPTVLIEALLAGLPVVSTDCPHGPREILEAGAYGTLVPVGDVEALADAMARALDAPRDPARQRERAMAFTVEAAGDRYEALFRA